MLRLGVVLATNLFVVYPGGFLSSPLSLIFHFPTTNWEKPTENICTFTRHKICVSHQLFHALPVVVGDSPTSEPPLNRLTR